MRAENRSSLMMREQIVLDEEFLGRISLRCCSPNRAYHLPSSCLINLTYGKRLEANHEGMDLLDSGPRGVTSHGESPAAGHRGVAMGGKRIKVVSVLSC